MGRLRVGVAVLTVALLGASWLHGQGEDKKGDKPAKLRGILPQYYKKLGLRDDQVQAIYRLRTDYRAKTDELKRQLKELKAKEKEATEKVLTAEQLKRLREFQKKNASQSKQMLDRLQQAVIKDENVFAVLMDAVRVCSLGEITHALFEVGGQYRRNM